MSETSVEIVDLECDNIVSPDAIVHRNNIVSSNAIMLGMRNVTHGEAILIVMLFCIVML